MKAVTKNSINLLKAQWPDDVLSNYLCCFVVVLAAGLLSATAAALVDIVIVVVAFLSCYC